MDFSPSPLARDLSARLARFMDDLVLPSLPDWHRHADAGVYLLAMGPTPDTPLARLWSWGRALRLLDGPDEVHLRTVARAELSRATLRRGANAAHLRRWRRPETG